MMRILHMALVLLLLAAAVPGQVSVVPPHFGLMPVAGPFTSSAGFMGMEADKAGNVYILEGHSYMGTPGSVTLVRPDGTVLPGHASGFGGMGQLAADPTDGFVYLAEHSPFLTVIQSTIWRLDPAGGATQMGTVPVSATGFTIDNDGRMYFLGYGLQGYGLYRRSTSGATPSYLGSTSFGMNYGHGVLQALVSGDVLVAEGRVVTRYVDSSSQFVPFYTGPAPVAGMPGHMQVVMSMGRTPHNQLGGGALLGVHDMSMVNTTGTVVQKAVSADLTGGNQADFLVETYTVSPMTGMGGMGLVAGGFQDDTWWLSGTGVSMPMNPGMTATLYRVEQLPAQGGDGSLLVGASPGSLSVDLYGPAGAPFILGVVAAPLSAGVDRFLPPFGVIDLDPFDPAYIPVLDGVGLFGAWQPSSAIPGNGHFTWSLSHPALPVPVSFFGQALVAGLGEAPNGAFYVSNVVAFDLQ